MKIVVDAFGGDHAPIEIIKGCALAVKEYGVTVVLVGDSSVIEKTIADENIDKNGLEIVHAPEVITMEDDPLSVIKSKKNSSMATAFRVLKDGNADAFVSAGNSGAVLVGATMIVKRIKGVKRAALAPVIPSDQGPMMLIDCGANVECTPEYLVQFGIMGSLYMKHMFHLENPRVGLLNNGTEECKGTSLQKEAYPLLAAEKSIHFIGNVEARDMVFGACDVAVADGFTGNIALKVYEGVGKMLAGNISNMFKKNLRTKLGALFVMDGINAFRKKMDYKEHGGAPLMGISKPVVKAHGSSDARAFKNAIHQAILFANSGMIEQIEKNIVQTNDLT